MTILKDISDRELNRRMATEVMNWLIIPDGEHRGDKIWLENSENYPHIEDGEFLTLWRNPDVNGEEWNPTTNIVAAMQVVEKMQEQEFDVKMKYSEWTDNKRRWLVEFDGVIYSNANGNALPRAICEAAHDALDVMKDYK